MRVLSMPKCRPVEDHGDFFFQLAGAISAIDQREATKTQLLEAVGRMHKSGSDECAFLEAFQSFMVVAAQHPAVIAPFLPAFGRLLEATASQVTERR